MWDTNEIGGEDAFANLGQTPPPTGTGTGTGGAPTSPTGTTTGPIPTGTSTGPVPTTTGTGPIPTTTSTGTSTVPTSTGTATSTDTSQPPPPPAGNSGPCSVTLDFTTVSVNGRYAPRHVEAAWVETQSGQFVHTLEAFGTIRIGNLVTWNAQSFANTVDAVTGATIAQHRAHTVTWDCIDLQNAPVADGTYRIVAEFTEDNSGGFFGPPTQKISVEFLKGTDPLDFTVADTNAYRGIHLVYQ